MVTGHGFLFLNGGLVFSLDFFLELMTVHLAELLVCWSKVELLKESGLSGVVMDRYLDNTAPLLVCMCHTTEPF